MRVDGKVRVGIIGCGLMGRLHAQSLCLLPYADLAAACDIREDAAEALIADYGGVGSYAITDPSELMADRSLDGLLICTHHDTHHSLALQSLQAGKHVFIEKPLAPILSECQEIRDTANDTGLHTVVGFFARFAPAVQEVKSVGLRPIATVAQMSSERWADDSWAQDPGRGGGNVSSQGCHLLDLCCYLQGEEPISVTAHGGTLTHEQGPVDTVAATIRFASGSVTSLFISDAGVTPHVGKAMLQLFCVDKTVAIHHLFGGERGQTVWWPAKVAPVSVSRGPRERDYTGHLTLIERFVTGIRTGTLPAGTPTAQDGVRVAALLKALFFAVRNRKLGVGVDL
jgi:predicted dehydrogenase